MGVTVSNPERPSEFVSVQRAVSNREEEFVESMLGLPPTAFDYMRTLSGSQFEALVAEAAARRGEAANVGPPELARGSEGAPIPDVDDPRAEEADVRAQEANTASEAALSDERGSAKANTASEPAPNAKAADVHGLEALAVRDATLCANADSEGELHTTQPSDATEENNAEAPKIAAVCEEAGEALAAQVAPSAEADEVRMLDTAAAQNSEVDSVRMLATAAASEASPSAHGNDLRAPEVILASGTAPSNTLCRLGFEPPPGYTEGDLRRAVASGDVEGTRALLEAGVSPNAADEVLRGWPPLHFAAYRGHTAVVAVLGEHGADPLARDKDGDTALTHARYWGHAETAAELERQESRALQKEDVVGEASRSVDCVVLTPETLRRVPLLECHDDIEKMQAHRVTILCSAPEFACNGDKMHVGLAKMCNMFSEYVKFGFDWAGGATKEPIDTARSRVVHSCCKSEACLCGDSELSRTISGPVDWSNPLSVADSQWFQGYKQNVTSAIGTEAQRSSVSLIEMLAIHGGPVSQLEQRTMPHVISAAVLDLRKKGISIGLPEEDEKITVFLHTMEYTEFFDRFLGRLRLPWDASAFSLRNHFAFDLTGKLVNSNLAASLAWWLSTSAGKAVKELNISERCVSDDWGMGPVGKLRVDGAMALADAIPNSSLQRITIGPKATHLPINNSQITELKLRGQGLGPPEALLVAVAVSGMPNIRDLDLVGCRLSGTECKAGWEFDKDMTGFTTLCSAIAHLSMLRAIDLSFCGLGPHGLAELTRVVGSTGNVLEILRCGSNPGMIGQSSESCCFKDFCEKLKLCKLKVIDFSNCGIGGAGGGTTELLEYVRDAGSTLTKIDLRCNEHLSRCWVTLQQAAPATCTVLL